jgi:uncharacterized protein (DUF4415 family)
MPGPKKLTAKQTAHMTCMMDVKRRLEWDLHNPIDLTGRIPEEWHRIATATPRAAKVKVTLALEADVLKFFESMGEGYGPRINDVLKSYMHARLAGVIRGAETLAQYREREEAWSGEKPAFGDVARVTGGAWEDVGPPVVEAVRVRVQEAAAKGALSRILRESGLAPTYGCGYWRGMVRNGCAPYAVGWNPTLR